MKRITTFLLLAVLSIGAEKLTAQDIEFHHGLGASYSIASAEFVTMGAPAITYHPRLAMELDGDMSLALGVPVSLGFYMSTLETGNYLVYELPATIDFNFGFGALESTRSDFGGFIGAGYGIYGLSGGIGNVSGLYAHLGARFIFKDIPFSVSAYTYQTFDEVTVFGGRIIYELTDF